MSEREATIDSWQAGPVATCDKGSDHRVSSVHVIVRCVCGAAFMSTDAAIAFGMASAHANHFPGEPS